MRAYETLAEGRIAVFINHAVRSEDAGVIQRVARFKSTDVAIQSVVAHFRQTLIDAEKFADARAARTPVLHRPPRLCVAHV